MSVQSQSDASSSPEIKTTSSFLQTSQFHLFPLLPFELRLKIYHIALSIPRIIPIACERDVRQPGNRRYAKNFTSSLPPPPLLFVSHESRTEALSFYTPSFLVPSSTTSIYINFSLDTPLLEDTVLSHIPHSTQDSIRRLILEVKDSLYFGHFNMVFLKGMRQLEEVEIRAGKGLINIPHWSGEDAFVKSLVDAFLWERKDDKEWVCPRVRIIDDRTGMERAALEGGKWVDEEEGEGAAV